MTPPRILIIALIAAAAFVSPPPLRAADVTWNNGSASFLWNLTDLNWSTGAWNNANGDGAVFTATGAGAINVTSPINVDSLEFAANGYTLGGAGSLTFVAGSSSLGTGFINTETGVTATINTAINSSLGIIKLGAGTLNLGGPITFSGGGFPIDGRGVLTADYIVGGGSSSGISGGTTTIMNTSVLPATTRVGISDGLLNIGANNITIGALTFINQADFTPFDPGTNSAGVGVIGTGTLRVTGDINVLGTFDGNFGTNTVATNLNMGGGTQIVRVAANGSFNQTRALQFTGVLSNGSLLKTFGITENGVMGQPDGMALYGNNTYTGSTTLNGGPTIITGTNATTLVTVVGDRGAFAPAGTSLTLQGANGSLGGATTIQAFAGAQFIIDNGVAIAAGGDTPTVPAAQNNNRIRDDAEIQLRDGAFIYRGLTATAASETFGNLNVLGGSSTLTLSTSGVGGTATVTASGNLTLGPRATLQFSSATLGAATRFFVNGTLPAADATGILPRIASTTDFLTYSGATGFTPFTGYAADFSTPGTNVAVTADSTIASSVNINALKRTGTITTTIAAGQTLGITSGMNLQVSGTGTFTGGTVAFGANPGVFFAGSGSANTMVNSAVTGSAGLINTNATLTLAGDLSGLTGSITSNSTTAVTTLATNTFGGSIVIREGQFNINTNQTLAGQGAIMLGTPENDDHLINNFAQLNIAGAGANAIIGRDIIVDHGSFDAAGLQVTFGFLPSITPLSNTTGSQTLSGNITLNSPVRLQGGGGGGTGSTTLSGNISGPAQFYLSNGRDLFTGNVGNAGGFRVGEGGFTAQVSFLGTATGNAPIVMEGGNSTFIAYNSGSLPTGPITVEGTNASGTGTTASINPLQNSTINNPINLGLAVNPGTVIANVASGVIGNWNGVVSGVGGVVKNGTGTLVLGNAANTYTGNTTVNAGTLLVNGSSASPSHVVNNTGTLGGNGTVGPVGINTGGTLSPGSSIGTFTTGNLSLSGTFLAEINLNNGGAASADLLNVAGSFSITNGTLMLSLSNLPAGGAMGDFLLVANDGVDPISGTFGSITGLPGGVTATVDYAFVGTDSLGRVGNGNDLAVHIIPEPQSWALLAFGALSFLAFRLRRRSA